VQDHRLILLWRIKNFICQKYIKRWKPFEKKSLDLEAQNLKTRF
jgi:hypothetical protein